MSELEWLALVGGLLLVGVFVLILLLQPPRDQNIRQEILAVLDDIDVPLRGHEIREIVWSRREGSAYAPQVGKFWATLHALEQEGVVKFHRRYDQTYYYLTSRSYE